MKIGDILVDARAGVFAVIVGATQTAVTLELMDRRRVEAGSGHGEAFMPVRAEEPRLLRRRIHFMPGYGEMHMRVNGYRRNSSFKIWDGRPADFSRMGRILLEGRPRTRRKKP